MISMPRWEQRVRAPQLLTFSLLGPSISWAADHPGRGVLLATTSGAVEVYAFDATDLPAPLTQVTSRDQGTTGAAVSRDGSTVYWFDDRSGDELGRWVAAPFDDPARTIVLLPELEPAYSSGFQPLSGGAALIGRIVGDSFELARAEPDGSGRVVHTSTDLAGVEHATPDGELALLEFPPDGDFLHPATRVVRTADGSVVAELREDLVAIRPVAFHPSDPGRVLLVHDRADRPMPMIWDTRTGEQHDVVTGLEGDVSAMWYPDGDALLVTVLDEARHRTYRLDLQTHELTLLGFPAGAIARSAALTDGSVHALISR
ncbi:MAG TPA: hypothetical protein VMT43_04370, partial [Acidimicrobiales bacterium]|nr:hypothetical protein [Acidimicrobiales bacterium]